jgi:hypothetical protein
MKEKLKTIKVEEESIERLNFIAGVIKKKQYEVVAILSQKEQTRLEKKIANKK